MGTFQISGPEGQNLLYLKCLIGFAYCHLLWSEDCSSQATLTRCLLE